MKVSTCAAGYCESLSRPEGRDIVRVYLEHCTASVASDCSALPFITRSVTHPEIQDNLCEQNNTVIEEPRGA